MDTSERRSVAHLGNTRRSSCYPKSDTLSRKCGNEKIVRLTSIHLLTSKWHEGKLDLTRLLEWNQGQGGATSVDEIFHKANEAAKRLLITEVGNALEEAERNMYDSRIHSKTELFKRLACMQQNKMQEQQHEIEVLRQQV
ncbi:hypothetical protein RB195_025183 [Necator americanus]|uniref:Uncharacterized protein n=1 Tax=Necator americanus TaxID=51031 RepID=A0ABR1ER77_NECAM